MIRRPPMSLSLVITVAFGLGLVASMYLNVYQHKRAEDDRKLMQGQITDLRYQVNLDKAAATSPSPSPTATPEARPSPSVAPSPGISPEPTPATAVLGDSTAKTATVKTPGNLHLGPSVSSKVVLSYTKLPAGSVVTTGAVSGKYRQITYNGVTGYILATSLQ